MFAGSQPHFRVWLLPGNPTALGNYEEIWALWALWALWAPQTTSELVQISPIHLYLVGGLEHFLFSHRFGNNHPNWLIFFRGVETTNQIWFMDSPTVRRWHHSLGIVWKVDFINGHSNSETECVFLRWGMSYSKGIAFYVGIQWGCKDM